MRVPFSWYVIFSDRFFDVSNSWHQANEGDAHTNDDIHQFNEFACIEIVVDYKSPVRIHGFQFVVIVCKN